MQTRAVWTALLLGILAPMHAGRRDAVGSELVRILFHGEGAGQAVVVNRTLRPIGIGLCEPRLERLQEEGWVPLGRPARGCERELGFLMPGDSGTLRFPCPALPGTYRLSLAVVLEQEELDPLTSEERSPPFTLAPSATQSGPCSTAPQDR